MYNLFLSWLDLEDLKCICSDKKRKYRFINKKLILKNGDIITYYNNTLTYYRQIF